MSNLSFTGIMQGILTALQNATAIAGPTGPTGPAGPNAPVYGKVASNGTLQTGSVGIASVVRNGTGSYTITFSTSFGNTRYKPFLTGDQADGQTPKYTCTDGLHMDVSAFNDTAFTVMVLP